MNVPPKVAEYEGRISISDGCAPLNGAINICYHDWSPHGQIVLEMAMKDRVDESYPVNVMLMKRDEQDSEKQVAVMGDTSHGWGELLFLNGEYRSKLTRLESISGPNGIEWHQLTVPKQES